MNTGSTENQVSGLRKSVSHPFPQNLQNTLTTKPQEGSEILRDCSPPALCDMSCVTSKESEKKSLEKVWWTFFLLKRFSLDLSKNQKKYWITFIWSRLFGPVNLDPSILTHLFEPVYLDPPNWNCLTEPVQLAQSLLTSPFVPVFL